MAIAGVALVTVLLLPVDRKLAVSLVPITYLVPVIVAATQWGLRPATLASLVSVAAADFFFIPPVYSFRIDEPRDVVDLLLFLVVSLVSSNLASRLKRETDALRLRERELQKLYELSRRLAGCFTITELISAIREYLSRHLGPRGAFFVASPDGLPEESGRVPKAVRDSLQSIAAAAGAQIHTIVDSDTHDIWLVRAISSKSSVHGIIAINIGRGSERAVKTKTQGVEAILQEVSVTLQRLDIGKAMEDARSRLQAELLRDAFHGTLSHELCSPLAAIQGSASVLATVPTVQENPQARSLLEAISEEVTQLDGYIQNLLHATRVTAGGLKPRLEWADPRDIVNAAVKRAARWLCAHKVVSAFDDDLPLVNVDSGLIEEVCAQLLQNAAKYSPAGSTVSIRLSADTMGVALLVSDQGVGITPDDLRELGCRSFRSERHQAAVPGSGLGFWIASNFVKANGGTITVSSRGLGMGTTVCVSLPASQPEVSELTVRDDE